MKLFRLILVISLVILTSCSNSQQDTFKLDLADIVETGYSNTVDGDSMYWAIYEEWSHDCERHLLYMDRETFDSLESAVKKFHKAELEMRDSLNNTHGFTLLRDSEGLHLCSIR